MILNKINQLKEDEISETISKRIVEFKENGNSEEKIFSEMCFCILTANSTAENCIRVQEIAGKYFQDLDEKELAEKLKDSGCRFHTKRANYISVSREKKQNLIEILDSLKGNELREWLVENIKGFGMKEASHFLRNIGFEDFAIIDFHIIDLLVKEEIIKKPEKLSKQAYLEIENKLRELSKKADLTLAELDLYLWYMETGKVLK